MLFYKVVEIKQKQFARGYMTPSDLQSAINQWANMGWVLDRMTSAETQGFLQAKDVFLLIFKREVEIPEGFHIMINNQPAPVSQYDIGQLRMKGLLTPTTLACKKGMEGWHPLGAVVPALAEVIATQ